jgi:multidrug efflux system outer membrane protein
MARATLCAVSLLLGCSVGPDYVRPKVAQPASYKSPAPQAEQAALPRAWWRLYRDPGLDRLIAMASASNQSLKQAIARVDEARALARVAGADFYPSVVLHPSVTAARTSGNRPSITGGSSPPSVTSGDWLVPVDLSYEVDIWGRVRREVQAAKAQAAASVDDAAVIQLGVQTDVAQFYYTVRLLDAELAILAQTIVAYEQQVQLLSVQLRTGLVGPSALNQAQAQLSSTLAQQQETYRLRANTEHALAVLCGRPAPMFGLAADPAQQAAPPAIPPGLPASVLRRRPDIARAEHNLIATNAFVGVATADMLPQLTLSGRAGVESESISSLFDWKSRMASVVAGLTAPLFEGGRLKAKLDAARARKAQAVAAYVNQVLIAYSDVEDALNDLHTFAAQAHNLDDAVRASAEYLRLAEVQYKNGLVDYLTVVDAERTLLSNQLAFVQATNSHMNASIHLVKALGGGWRDAEIAEQSTRR